MITNNKIKLFASISEFSLDLLSQFQSLRKWTTLISRKASYIYTTPDTYYNDDNVSHIKSYFKIRSGLLYIAELILRSMFLTILYLNL